MYGFFLRNVGKKTSHTRARMVELSMEKCLQRKTFNIKCLEFFHLTLLNKPKKAGETRNIQRKIG